ncbi:MAG TPA: terminase small subunit [Stellaceae bacterium]|nr:terminase small subunit [Stellaceae bacterium]
MTSRSGRRPSPATAPRQRRGKTAAADQIGEPAAALRLPARDEITLRAARLGITPERILQEYARIAFADLRRIADWGPKGLIVKNPETLSEEDAAAISEIVSGAAGYRIKLYDKKAALDAIARHLGMFMRTEPQPEDEPDTVAEDAREVLARRLARLAAGGAEE